MPTHKRIDELLAEDDWIRRMARRLVPDPGLADDLAQDAWVSALGKSGEARALRPWLGGVLRNLLRSKARSAGRREERERSVARAEALPSTAELVEEVTLRREVADHLLALAEPYRSTLYLRFFRDLSLKKIARQMDVPVSTVHGRLQRGLELMRVRMDQTHGGDRRAWAVALLPLAKSSTGLAATTLGGVAMSTGFKVAASIVVAGSALGIWIQTRESRALEAPGSATVPEVARATPAPEAALELVPVESVRAEVGAGAAPPAAPEPVDVAPERLTLSGRVIDTARQPVAGIEVGFQLENERRLHDSTTTDAGGRFSMERSAPEPEAWAAMNALYSKIAGGELRVIDPLFTTLAVGIIGAGELILVAAPRLDFAGLVVDEAGSPIEDVRLTVRVRQGLYREIGLTQFASFSEADAWATKTDAAGTFRIDGACGGERLFLDVVHASYEPVELELPAHAQDDLEIVLARIDGTIDVTGRVIDAGGAPVANSRVSMGHTIELTEEDGTFTIPWNAKEEGNTSFVKRGDGVWVSQQAPLHIAALKSGHAPAWLDLEQADLAVPLELRLGPAPLSIAGRVVDEDGAPLAGMVLWAKDLTSFGRHYLQQGEEFTWRPATIEEETRAGARTRGTTTAADGSFELGGLMPKDYTLQVFDPRTAALGQGWTLAAGTREAELVLGRDPSLAYVAGRIVSLVGEPIPGVLIQIERSSDAWNFGTYPSPPEDLMQPCTTDADGRFAFPELATADTKLLLFGERIFFRFVALADFEDLAHVEIVEPLLCELQIELGDAPELADHVQVLDEDGGKLDIVESHGMSVTVGGHARIREGRSGVLRVPETARTLVLYLKSGNELEEVARRPLALDPRERTVLRP